MQAHVPRTAAYAAVLFFTWCLPANVNAYSLLEHIVQPHPLYALGQKAMTDSRIETDLRLNEWARNLDSPKTLLFEDRSVRLNAAYRLNRHFLIETGMGDRYHARNYSKSFTGPDNYPVLLTMANSVNEPAFSLGLLAHQGTDRALLCAIQGAHGPLGSQISATCSGTARLFRTAPFLSFRQDFPDCYGAYTVHTQVSSNPFQYQTLCNRRTWIFGAGIYNPWQKRPVVVTQILQYIDPRHISAGEDSLALHADLSAGLVQLPCDIGKVSTDAYLGLFAYNGLLDLFYLNVSGMGYSTVVSPLPVRGAGFGALLRSRIYLSTRLGLEALAGYGSADLDSISGKAFNLAKYEVISQGNYICSGSASLTAWVCAASAHLKFLTWNTARQSLGLLRIYPRYALDWETRPLFTAPTQGSSETEIIFSDFLVYRGGWDFTRGAWTIGLELDQGIPLRTRYARESAQPQATGENKKTGTIIGLGRVGVKVIYHLPGAHSPR